MINTFYSNKPEYPVLLKQALVSSPDLHIVGNNKLSTKTISLIGSTTFSTYGCDVTASFINNFYKQGFTIVTAIQQGINTIIIEKCLEVGCPVIGVLDCGFNYLFTHENYLLCRQLLSDKNNCLVSPFKHNQARSKATKVESFKIVTGIGHALVLLEASSLNEVFYAIDAGLDQGRTIYAVPGSIFNKCSYGTNKLIKSGAVFCDNVVDIIQDLNLNVPD